MKKIASFTVNHLDLLPGIYVSRKDHVGDNVITTFDLRVTRPNVEPPMDTAGIHTVEHIFATFLRNNKEWADKTIYFGPMGCRTGFYLVMWGDVEAKAVKEGLERSLEKVLNAEEMIAATSVECGNYRDLSLFGAKEYAKYVLEQGFSLNIYGE